MATKNGNGLARGRREKFVSGCGLLVRSGFYIWYRTFRYCFGLRGLEGLDVSFPDFSGAQSAARTCLLRRMQ